MSVRYADYIQSMDWVNRCVRFFGDYPNCAVRSCRRRWRDGQVGIHHRTYARLGRELKEDLVPLCRGCHGDAHRWAKWHVDHDGLDAAAALEKGTAMVVGDYVRVSRSSIEAIARGDQ